jgi:hypothetical protein
MSTPLGADAPIDVEGPGRPVAGSGREATWHVMPRDRLSPGVTTLIRRSIWCRALGSETRRTMTMRRRVSLVCRLPPGLSRFRTPVPDRASMGDTQQPWGKGPLLSQALGVVTGWNQRSIGVVVPMLQSKAMDAAIVIGP